jgi:hypothetical protein
MRQSQREGQAVPIPVGGRVLDTPLDGFPQASAVGGRATRCFFQPSLAKRFRLRNDNNAF